MHLNNRELYWPRAKMLGGCSAMNAMMSILGNAQDFDEWESMGNPGWSFNSLKHLYKKSETLSVPIGKKVPPNHGTNGPMAARYCPIHDISKAAIAAQVSMGISNIQDFNNGSNLGVSAVLHNVTDTGFRSSAFSYLSPDTLDRPNLQVITSAYVSKIAFEQNRAIGIEYCYTENGPTYFVHASKEVLLCAGAIGSPQLLMCSGIGPQADLEALNIPVIANLPVGKNLIDHLALAVYSEVSQGSSLNYLSNPIRALPSLIRWLFTGKGDCVTPFGEVASFIRSDNEKLFRHKESLEDSTSGDKAADLEIVFGPITFMNHGLTPIMGYKGSFATLGGILLRPTSRGWIKLSGPSIFAKPIIDPNYMATEHDQRKLLRVLRLIIDLWSTEPLKSFTVKDPNYKAKPKRSPKYLFYHLAQMKDEELIEYMKSEVETLYHPVGTVKMGSEEQGGCVDETLKVRGITGLRVVDASIMPNIVSGHTAIPVVIIAEKAAEMIQYEYELL
jgi:choline dehydrogenase